VRPLGLPQNSQSCIPAPSQEGLSLGMVAVSHTTVRAVGARADPPLIIHPRAILEPP
jgi:hypothetical protein